MKVLNREEIRRLIDASSGYLRGMIILALNTGMRKNEIFSLKWNDVDFAANYIYVKETKSNVMRKIPMNSVVRSLLKGIKRESDFVFTSPKTGKRFIARLHSFYTTREKAGIPDVRFHDLRHTAATPPRPSHTPTAPPNARIVRSGKLRQGTHLHRPPHVRYRRRCYARWRPRQQDRVCF